MPCSSSNKLTLAEVLSIFILALINLPVDLTFTNNSVSVTASNSVAAALLVAGDILLAGPDLELVKVSSVSGPTITLKNVYAGNTATRTSVTRRWEFYQHFDAAPGSSSYALARGGSNDEMHIAVIDEDGLFTGVSNNVIERFNKVSKASDARYEEGNGSYYKTVINDQSKYVWWAGHATVLTTAGTPVTGVNFGSGAGTQTVASVSLVKGRDGSTPRAADYVNGYDLFNNPEETDISLILGGESTQTVAIHLINNIGRTVIADL